MNLPPINAKKFKPNLQSNRAKRRKPTLKVLSNFLQVVTKINAIDYPKHQNFKDELRDAILGDLRNTQKNEVSRYILSVYENGNTESLEEVFSSIFINAMTVKKSFVKNVIVVNTVPGVIPKTFGGDMKKPT